MGRLVLSAARSRPPALGPPPVFSGVAVGASSCAPGTPRWSSRTPLRRLCQQLAGVLEGGLAVDAGHHPGELAEPRVLVDADHPAGGDVSVAALGHDVVRSANAATWARCVTTITCA